MLAIGRAMMGKPRILLLDEPSLGLAPVIVDMVFKALQQLNREGLTLLLVEQNARRALEITDTAFVIKQGKIVQHGESAALLKDPQIIAHYLGQAA
jgi:branched-chain amino acid transport system ATP-binding protein